MLASSFAHEIEVLASARHVVLNEVAEYHRKDANLGNMRDESFKDRTPIWATFVNI